MAFSTNSTPSTSASSKRTPGGTDACPGAGPGLPLLEQPDDTNEEQEDGPGTLDEALPMSCACPSAHLPHLR
eukprot:CAMPEP_0172719630 /NCGR_PEP_ID=MMETSP1074-20121228/75614_1 /TAXON_ID=2916 /ORGANISM="Ceratium fusus, Strain PA161109" /LENGTH=71 /DNA_ID=CAMNT_0013544999 /DNA_START=480 /DNA_END=691 /DNA_ORIENTATION=+